MKLIEVANKNTEGMAFINKLRKTIKDMCDKGMREEFENVTDDDVDKMSLMLEHNFFVGVTSDDSEWDLNTITDEEAQFLIDMNIGLFSLMRGLEKNRRQSYKEILLDVLSNLNGLFDDEELLESSEVISKIYETIKNNGSDEDGYDFSVISEEDLEMSLTDIYQLMIKDIINN